MEYGKSGTLRINSREKQGLTFPSWESSAWSPETLW